MSPLMQTVLSTLVASLVSPLILYFVGRYLDRKKNKNLLRVDDLDALERYQRMMEQAAEDVEREKQRRVDLEKRVADLEAATIGPFEIVLTVETRPVPIIKSQSIRIIPESNMKTP